MNSLLVPSVPWLNLVVRGAVVYVVVIFLLRLGGKKQVGQMGIAEFAALLLMSNAVQNSMNGGDCSLTGGLAVAAVVVAMSSLFSFMAYKSRRLEAVLQGRPRLLIHNGELIEKNMELEQLNFRELRQMLRHQGVHDVRHIAEAVIESNGALSVVLKAEHPAQ